MGRLRETHQMKPHVRRTVAALSCFFLVTFAFNVHSQDLRTEVARILARPQARSGEHVDLLVQLGRPAVPILLEKLETHEHPMVIVEALGRIGDAGATVSLLNLLNRLEPFSETKGEHHAQRIMLIAALRELGDCRAEPLLHSVLLSEKVHIGTRLAAASALARFGSPDAREKARSFIMEVQKEAHEGKYGNLRTGGPFHLTELNQALSEVGSDISRAILIDRLLSPAPAHEKLALIEVLVRRPDPKVLEALEEVCKKPQAEAHLQRAACAALGKFTGEKQ